MTNIIFKKPECVQLLSQLKSTVEELLSSHQVDVLGVYGGLQRLVLSIHPIICHQYKHQSDNKIDVWPFIHEVFLASTSYTNIIQIINKASGLNRCLLWLEKSLKTYTLSQQLSLLLENKEMLEKYYNDESFLLQSQFSSALLTCLRAIELNDSSLLAEVNPVKIASESTINEGFVRRSSLNLSFDSGVNLISKEDKTKGVEESICSDPLSLPSTSSSESIPDNQSIVKENCNENFKIPTDCNITFDLKQQPSIEKEVLDIKKDIKLSTKQFIVNGLCKDSQSFVEDSDVKSCQKLSINEHNEIGLNSKNSNYIEHRLRSPSHGRSASDIGLFLKSQPNKTIVQESRSDDKLNINIEKKTLQRHSNYFLKQPKDGQSLISFFMSHNFNSCTDLDRENAHFNFAETLLSVVEQVKWNQSIKSKKVTFDEAKDDSFAQRVRIRKKVGKKQSLVETALNTLDSDESLSSGSDQSCHGDNIDDSSLSEFSQSNLQVMREAGVSLSLASLYSDADFKVSNRLVVPERSDLARSEEIGRSVSPLSADVIAINLLKKFSNHNLPKASEVDWPLMEDYLSSKKIESVFKEVEEDFREVEEDCDDSKQLRGSFEWAPPRPQIISTVHDKPKLFDGLIKQNNLCAGCGSKVDRSCAKRYIFCEYLGKYFCPCCHNKSKSVIPARILSKWDFGLYSISHFAFDFLSRNKQEPWFHIPHDLYNKVSVMNQIKQCRVQLHYFRQFIQVCNSKARPEDVFDCPPHWFTSINNIDSFSLLELESAKKKQFLSILQEKVDVCLDHIRQCILCQARGFICEVCSKEDDVLFPFEVQRVAICQSCKASFHKKCFNPNSCPKCARLLRRKKTRTAS